MHGANTLMDSLIKQKMYRNQALIRKTRWLFSYALDKTNRIPVDDVRLFMKDVVWELYELSQLRSERTARIERISNNDDEFRRRYLQILIDTVEYYRGVYYARWQTPWPDIRRVRKQFNYMKLKLENLLVYKTEESMRK